MVDEEKVFEKRLMACVQLGSVQSYADEFLSLAMRLPNLSDGFKQRCFARGSCAYLREKFADRDFDCLLSMVRYTLSLAAMVDEHLFVPDAQLAPVVAALPVRIRGTRGSRGQQGPCFRCGQPGHIKADCKVGLQKSHDQRAQHAGKSAVAPKNTAKFGRYDGSGQVHAVSADPIEEESDDDLRQGNDLA